MTIYTGKNGEVYIQTYGANREPIPLGLCSESGDLTKPLGQTSNIRCRNADGEYYTVGQMQEEPDDPSYTVQNLIGATRNQLEKIVSGQKFAVYVQQNYARKSIFSNGASGRTYIMPNCNLDEISWTSLSQRVSDDESMVDFTITPSDIWETMPVTAGRIATSETLALNDIAFNPDRNFTLADAYKKGRYGFIAADSAAGPAKGNVLYSANYSATWAAAAAQPFGAGLHVMAAGVVDMGNGARRIIVVQDAPGGAQGNTAYSDDNGATWTTVALGGAAAGHGAKRGGALFVLSAQEIWIASAAGYIYKSVDAGASWTAQESGTITAGNYNCIHFYDSNYGVAVAAAGITAYTRDGGAHWTQGATVTATPALNTCAMVSTQTAWVGTATGKLFWTWDNGTTYTERTFTGSGAGAVTSLSFVNEYIGYMSHNNASPVGTIYRTRNGGYSWEAITTPTNSGINRVVAIDENTATAVGEANGGTGFICYISE